MTVFVMAATKHGLTGEIAKAIGAALTERGKKALVLPTGEVRHIGEHAAVVVGSAVYGGHGLPSATAPVDRGSSAWAGRPVWLFSSGPVGDPARTLTQKMGADPVDLPKIRATTGAREHRIFPGKLDPKDLPFMQRAPLFLFRGMKGDFRDWEAIRAWATVIADALHQNQTPAH
jgi:menaquinone-dependent protoporphyrinogen oxidase